MGIPPSEQPRLPEGPSFSSRLASLLAENPQWAKLTSDKPEQLADPVSSQEVADSSQATEPQNFTTFHRIDGASTGHVEHQISPAATGQSSESDPWPLLVSAVRQQRSRTSDFVPEPMRRPNAPVAETDWQGANDAPERTLFKSLDPEPVKGRSRLARVSIAIRSFAASLNSRVRHIGSRSSDSYSTEGEAAYVVAEDDDTRQRRKPRRRWQKLSVAALSVFILYLGMVVKAELAGLPDNALQGAVLQARIQLAPVLNSELLGSAATSNVVQSTTPKPVVRRQSHSGATKKQKSTTSAGAKESNGVVLESRVKPLRPFRIEVVDGHGSRVLDARPNGVSVEMDDTSTLMLPYDASRQRHDADAAAGGSVVLRAMIGKDGRPEQLWKVSGPPGLSDEAMRIAKGAHFGPYYRDGAPMEMEAILTIIFPAVTK